MVILPLEEYWQIYVKITALDQVQIVSKLTLADFNSTVVNLNFQLQYFPSLKFNLVPEVYIIMLVSWPP